METIVYGHDADYLVSVESRLPLGDALAGDGEIQVVGSRSLIPGRLASVHLGRKLFSVRVLERLPNFHFDPEVGVYHEDGPAVIPRASRHGEDRSDTSSTVDAAQRNEDREDCRKEGPLLADKTSEVHLQRVHGQPISDRPSDSKMSLAGEYAITS